MKKTFFLYVKIIIMASFCLVVLFGCDNDSGSDSLEDLKSEILNCAVDDKVRSDLEEAMNKQATQYTEEQRKKVMRKMKEVNCG